MLNFETKEQEAGFLSLSCWLRRHAIHSKAIRHIDLYFMQHFHDLSEWLIKVTGAQISTLQNDLKSTQETVDELKKQIAEINSSRQQNEHSLDELAGRK